MTESKIQEVDSGKKEADKEKSEKQGVEPKEIDEVKNKQEKQLIEAIVGKKRNRQATLFEMAGPVYVLKKEWKSCCMKLMISNKLKLMKN